MKPFDAVEFHKRKATREGNNEKSDNLKMEIIDEGTLEKALKVPEKL